MKQAGPADGQSADIVSGNIAKVMRLDYYRNLICDPGLTNASLNEYYLYGPVGRPVVVCRARLQ